MLCVRKISVAKKFMGNRGGGECQDFASKFFCLTVPKNLVGYPFRVSLISGIENFYASEGYVTIFCRNFLSHSAENFRRACFRVSLLSGLENFYASEGYVTIFFRIFLSHSAEKLRRGTLLCCVSESFRYRLSLRIRRGKISRFSVEKFLSHSVEKLGR